jgi:hypothetical protein
MEFAWLNLLIMLILLVVAAGIGHLKRREML